MQERLTEKNITYVVSSACVDEIPDIIEGKKYIGSAITKLGQYEDIDDRLKKYKEFGMDSLITLFSKLTDDDIERIVQMTFKERRKVYELKVKELDNESY